MPLQALVRRVALIVAVAAGASATPPVAVAHPVFSALVVFGDSLSDSGNAGRFTNGPVWVERLADGLGTPLRPSRQGGTNYAVGGAHSHGGTYDVRTQVQTYLAAHAGQADAQALYVVFGGANDLLSAGCEGGRERAVRTAAAAIRATVNDLAQAGAQRLLVPNLPDVGQAPIVRARGRDCAAEARRMTQTFNATLDRELADVARDRGVRIDRPDVFALADQMLLEPSVNGFRDTSHGCFGGDCEGALFWDQLHPTAAAHARVGDAALAAVSAPPD